jgi:hypothetical protein
MWPKKAAVLLVLSIAGIAQGQTLNRTYPFLTDAPFSGPAAVWDGYDNVFFSFQQILTQVYWDGSGWVAVYIDRGSICNTGAGSAGSVVAALAAGGTDHVFYNTPNALTLRHAFFDYTVGLWRCEDVATAPGPITKISALNIQGQLSVYYISASRVYHTFKNGAWTSPQPIDGPGIIGTSNGCGCAVLDIAVASHGTDQRVFYKGGVGVDVEAVRVASKASLTSGSWSAERLGSTSANIAATLVGQVIHVFLARSSGGVVHLSEAASGWDSSIVASGVLAGAVTAFPSQGGWAVALLDYYYIRLYRGQGALPTSSDWGYLTYPGWSQPKFASGYDSGGYVNIYVTEDSSFNGQRYGRLEQFWR